MDTIQMWPPWLALSVGAMGRLVNSKPYKDIYSRSQLNLRSFLYEWLTKASFAYLACMQFF